MKKSQIKNQLKKDISVASRSDFSKIMDRCNEESYQKEAILATSTGATIRSSSKFKYILSVATIFVLIFAVVFVLTHDFNSKKNASGYFVIDINPSIKLSYDEQGIVTDVVALNEDAEVLLIGLDFNDKSTDDVIASLFEKCVNLGYFSFERDNNAVMASATSDDGQRDEEMTAKIKELFSNEFSKSKMRGVVITGVQNAKLESTASEHGIDSQKYALILSYLDMGGELDESEYAEISISDLYKRISEKEKEAKQQIIDQIENDCSAKETELFASLAQSVNELIERLEKLISEASEEEKGQLESLEGKPNASGKGPSSLPNNQPEPNDKKGNSSHKEDYEGLLERLHNYMTDLEEAKKASECERAVSEILLILKEIKLSENEELSLAVDEMIEKISSLFEEFSKAIIDLSKLRASAEDINSARLDAFKDSSKEGSFENTEDWQNEKEEDIASSWYDFKKQWQRERQQDIMSKGK